MSRAAGIPVPSKCRTFGELAESVGRRFWGYCSFCKVDTDVFRYSTRHQVCDACAAERHDVVLPRVKRREKLDRAFGIKT